MNAPAVLMKLSQRFHTLRRRHMSVRLGTVLLVTVAALLATWMVLGGCDYLWELSLQTRQIVGGVALAMVLLGFVWQTYRVLRETRKRTFATLLETSFEEFGQRIRTVLDTVEGRVDGPSVMLAALGHQTLGRWETSTPDRILPIRKLLLSLALCIMMAVAASFLYVAGDQWHTAMLRAAGKDVPYTTFQVIPGNDSILEGLPLEVALRLKGRIDRDVALRYRTLPFEAAGESSAESDDQPWTELELSPTEDDPALFSVHLGSASRPTEYQFVTSVGATDVFHIEVRPRIEAVRVTTTVQPPAYTQLESRTFAASDATVLEQSQVDVVIETNHPLQITKLLINSEETPSIDASSVSGDRRQWTFTLPSSKTLTWQFSGSGSDETPMKPVSGRLRVRADQPPTLVWREPTQELRVSTLAEVPMHLLVSDDYGISEAGILFQLGGEEEYEFAFWSSETEEAGSPPTTRQRLEEILPLETLGLTERDYISYYAYAIDNRQPNPMRIESDVRYIDIRPLRQFFSEIELDPAAQNGGGSLIVQLDEIIRRQRFMINRTRRLTKATGQELASELRTIDRLVENQSELAGLTRFLVEFLVSRGNDDVEALNQAEATMLQASDSLAAANFDLALVQQEDALRSLAEARRTVELLIMKNRSRSQQAAMQQFARQLRQKLRRDRPTTEREIADTLEKIAQQQAQLATRAKQLNQPTQQAGGGTADATEATKSTSTDAEPTREEQLESLYADQIDLLERVKAIEQELSERLNSSKLLADRMKEAQSGMNSLATQARDAELDAYPGEAEQASQQLAEMGVQLKALSADEAVNRIASIRDLTTSLANLENGLSDQLQPTPQQRNSEDGELQNGSQPSDELSSRARQLQRRVETIEDVLNAPAELGDAETGEVNDQLQRFAEENEFPQLLTDSQKASGDLLDEEVTADEREPRSKEAYDRAVQYAEVAIQLDQLFRQMVEPRLARLRQLEQNASSLAQQMGKGKGGGQQNEDAQQESELTPEAKAGVAQLQRQLQDEGLQELAEMLQQQGSSGEGDAPGGGMMASQFDPAKAQHARGRVLLVIQEIQARIQEMILQDIVPDRDISVPPEYQQAVDNYLRALAGEASAVESEGGKP